MYSIFCALNIEEKWVGGEVLEGCCCFNLLNKILKYFYQLKLSGNTFLKLNF